MDRTEYEYRGLMAETWDLFRGDTSGWEDRFFYRNIIDTHGQPVLDVGCGTGRLLLDYMAEGIDIDGVDNSPEMLTLCRQKAEALGLDPKLYEQPMEALDLPRQYQLILVPSSSFQLLVEMDDAREAMARFYRHLLPDGVLAMPFMIFLDPGEPSRELDWKMIAEETRAEDGALLRKWSWASYDADTKLQQTRDRYEVLLDGEIIISEEHHRSPAVRWYSQAEARSLYREAGFTNLRVLKGFTQELASEDDTLFSILGYAA
ncbi:MAG: class I SAM-dependent methyltransferase [Anaerolineales bacterium]|nr:class I SAM-dependent methyltransferase [Anaerolineales bacterium]